MYGGIRLNGNWNWKKEAMTTAVEFNAKTNIETWEITTEGTVWVLVSDPRDPSGYKKQRVGGRAGGSKRLRLSTDDRRYNEEQIVSEMEKENPFRNGLLRLIDQTSQDDIVKTYHLTNDDLKTILEIRDEKMFEEAVQGITSELIIRRLAALAEKEATMAQLNYIKDLIEDRYKVGGTQKAVQEIFDDSTSGGIRLS
jgi:hypothetical protein